MSHAVIEAITSTARPAAQYAWRITTDHLWEPGDLVDDEAGTTGPSDAPEDLLAQLEAGKGTTFKMYDDDGELYYTGRILHAVENPDADADFGPLWDFGTPNAGCTEIRYRDKIGAWVTL